MCASGVRLARRTPAVDVAHCHRASTRREPVAPGKTLRARRPVSRRHRQPMARERPLAACRSCRPARPALARRQGDAVGQVGQGVAAVCADIPLHLRGTRWDTASPLGLRCPPQHAAQGDNGGQLGYAAGRAAIGVPPVPPCPPRRCDLVRLPPTPLRSTHRGTGSRPVPRGWRDAGSAWSARARRRSREERRKCAPPLKCQNDRMPTRRGRAAACRLSHRRRIGYRRRHPGEFAWPERAPQISDSP
jgi:hypothetical protein